MDSTNELSFLNVSTIALSKEDLQTEYHNLKKTLLSYQTDIETKKQENYNLKRELTLANALERDYLQEIEILQAGGYSEAQKIKSLEDEINNLKDNKREEIILLQDELALKEKEIINWETKFKKASNEVTAITNTVEIDNLLESNNKLKNDLNISVEKNIALQIKIDSIEELNIKLQRDYSNIQTELENTQEMYNCKKDDVIEANNLIETLQEDLMLTKNELDTIKTKPLDPACRGNSLFAEVNDKRLEMQSNMSTMKSQYIEMRKERATLLTKLTSVQQENTLLTKRWADDIKYKKHIDEELMEAYITKIKYLEETAKSYEDLKTETYHFNGDKFTPDQLQYFENRMTKKDAEIEKLLKRLGLLISSGFTNSNEMHTLQCELREWKSKANHIECELNEIKTQKELTYISKGEVKPQNCINCIKNKKSIFPKIKLLPKVQPPAVKSEPQIEKAETKVINQKIEPLHEIDISNKLKPVDEPKEIKKVSFKDDVLEPKPNKFYRPRGTILTWCPGKNTLPIIPKKDT